MDEKVLDSAFQRKYLPHWLLVGGVVLLIVSAIVWWTQVYENPYNVYWDMLASNLSTTSYTTHIEGDSNGTHIDQYTAQQFGANSLVYGRTTLSTSTNIVKNESIGTLTSDYLRYTKIKTSQKKANFSGVLNKWAKQSSPNVPASNSSSSSLYSQTLLGFGGGNLLPIANLTLSQRSYLIDQLHRNNIFNTTFNNVQKSKVNGQPVYVYTVTVEPVAYVAFEKQFANELGMHELDKTNPNDFQNQQSFQVELSVGVRSHHLEEVNYVGTQHRIYYSGYGVPLHMKVPDATMSIQTLQNLITQSQQRV